MKTLFRTAFAVLAIAIMAFANPSAAQQLPKVTIAWSHYTGWEPLDYMQSSGILKKWGAKYGVNLDLTPPMDYIESINQYTAGQFDAVAITNMDALTIPAVGGVDSTFIVVGDYSNGNDGILLKSGKPALLKDILGKPVKLAENTVSHYLLLRALQTNGLALDKVRVVNTSDSDIGSLFASGGEGTAVVTWNPILMTARQEKGAQLLFDSSKIPGEIIDGIVVRTNLSDNAKKAIVGAWYEVMKVMQEPGPAQQKAIELMAKSAGGTTKEFEAQLRTTHMFFSPLKAAEFTEDAKLKATMDFVRKFSFDLGLFGDAKSVDHVGIQFPDGKTLGNPRNVMLRFDTKFARMAVDGKL